MREGRLIVCVLCLVKQLGTAVATVGILLKFQAPARIKWLPGRVHHLYDLSVFARNLTEKVGDEARVDTPNADVTALRMRFPKDRKFVFDVEYSYRVDGVSTDFVEVSFFVHECLPGTAFPSSLRNNGITRLGRRLSCRQTCVFHSRLLLPTSCERKVGFTPNTHGRL